MGITCGSKSVIPISLNIAIITCASLGNALLAKVGVLAIIKFKCPNPTQATIAMLLFVYKMASYFFLLPRQKRAVNFESLSKSFQSEVNIKSRYSIINVFIYHLSKNM